MRRGGSTGLGGQRHSHTGPLRDRQRAASDALSLVRVSCVVPIRKNHLNVVLSPLSTCVRVCVCACYEVKLYASPVTADGLVIIATACRMAVAIII